MNVLVFDIETIPDVETGRRLYGLEGLSDKDVAEVMFNNRRQETDGSSDFLRLHLHKVVAISVVLSNGDHISVWSLGDIDADEKELLQRFYEGIEKYSPVLVSWNGSGFDLPVMHYRALLHGIQAPRYWETGSDDQSFRYNNYLNRYHERHTDLMYTLANDNRAIAPLDQIATMLGFPGKMGMAGGKVWDTYLEGDIQSIRNYCETDVLNTYLVYLRFELMRGNLTLDAFDTECSRLKDFLIIEKKPHLTLFFEAWNLQDNEKDNR